MQPLSVSQREGLEESVAQYQDDMTPEVAGFLTARGITRETAVTSRLGVVANPYPGHAQYRGMVSIPYLDREGKPLTLRFRNLNGEPKYIGIAGDITRMYNIGAIHRAVAEHSDEIHVTEGEFDALILQQIGLHAVAIPGANNWKNHHRRMLAGFSRVWVWGDPDDAGAEFTNRLCQAMRQARGVRLTAGDVTDTYKEHGKGALLALVGKE